MTLLFSIRHCISFTVSSLWRLCTFSILFNDVIKHGRLGQVPNAFDDPFVDEPQFLDVDQAFAFDLTKGDVLTVSFDIAEGYYLY